MRRTAVILSIFLLSSIFQNIYGQDKKWTLSGYVSNMESIMFQKANEDWITDNLIHNRLNFHYYPTSSFSARIELRNRFMFGQSIQQIQGYPQMIEADNGVLSLTKNISTGNSYLLNISVDRANIMFEKKNLNITLGRQRINWGQNYAWNPNDIFNSYSFFDFDYPEKPGADALRIQYYTGMASSVELAFKADKNDNLTGAGLVRFNKWTYDIQFMGGVLNSEDYVAGMGWSGNIYSIGFRGEASYFKPMKSDSESKDILIGGVSADYVFQNSLSLQCEFLYSQNAGDQTTDLFEYYNKDLSAKTMALSEYSLMTSVTYPFTPLLSGTFSTMYFPDSEGYFAGPSIDYSLTNNLSLSMLSQYFDINMGGNKIKLTMAFLRIKGNF